MPTFTSIVPIPIPDAKIGSVGLNKILNAGGAAGDLAYWNGSNWIKLTKGTSLQQFRMNVGDTAPEWFSNSANVYALVQTQTLAAAATTITFSSLDYNSDGMYILMGIVKNHAGLANTIKLYFNNDTTDGDYHTQEVSCDNAAISGQRLNLPRLAYINLSEATFVCYIQKTPSGYIFATSFPNLEVAANIKFYFEKITMDATQANLTRLDITSNQASGMDIGTSMSLYKLAKA